MNSILQKAIKWLGIVLCIAFATTAPQASARSHRARVQQGIIQTIDRDALLLRFQPTGQPEVLTIAWNSRTSFVKDTLSVTAAELRKGSLVTISYHTPFFGERFASKVVIERTLLDARKN